MAKVLGGALWFVLLCGCSSLLPRSEAVTTSPWQSYGEAQRAFDRIQPGRTTVADLKELSLDPQTNPNIAILNYADVLRRFMVSQSISISDLDEGVRECVHAKTLCRGFEVDQKLMTRHRDGNFLLDVLGFKRRTLTNGWRFQGLILLKENVVIYKLTGGQPTIAETENQNTPLGPVQSISGRVFGWTPLSTN